MSRAPWAGRRGRGGRLEDVSVLWDHSRDRDATQKYTRSFVSYAVR